MTILTFLYIFGSLDLCLLFLEASTTLLNYVDNNTHFQKKILAYSPMLYVFPDEVQNYLSSKQNQTVHQIFIVLE